MLQWTGTYLRLVMHRPGYSCYPRSLAGHEVVYSFVPDFWGPLTGWGSPEEYGVYAMSINCP